MAGWKRRDEGRYAVSGPLASAGGPGQRTVSWLELRRLNREDDLSLVASPDLQTLGLERIDGTNLAPLAGLGMQRLVVRDMRGVDLGPLAQLPLLEDLTLINFDDVTIPPLSLSPHLRWLTVINDNPKLTGRPVRQMITAIDWEPLAGLHGLEIRVGGLNEMRSIDLDLDLLRRLPSLERLDIYTGVRHSGPRPSPIEPPFEGLSRQLRFVRIAAHDPERVRSQLGTYLGMAEGSEPPGGGISVIPRYDVVEPRPPWSIVDPDAGEPWVAYGSLADADLGDADDTEYDACARAERRLRDADPALLQRLDFDPENAGTGIIATSREDLVRALDIIGIQR
jgi:hypothetical protein